MCFVGELQAPSPAPPGLAPPSRGAGSGPAAGLRAPARRLSPPAGALPASLPRRRARVRPCPRPRLAARRKQLETRQKVAAEEVQRGSGRAPGRRAATSDGRAARHSAAGRVERGGGGGGQSQAAQKAARGGRGVPAETYLCPRAAAGRRRAGRRRSRAGGRRCPREGPSRRSRPDAGGRRPGCPAAGRAPHRPAAAQQSRGGPGGSPPAPRFSAPAQRCPAPRRPRIRPAAKPQAAVAAALPARSEAETPGGGGGIILETQGRAGVKSG